MHSTTNRALVSAVILAYNLVQNRALPGPMYVPANIAVSAGLVALARREGISWRDLGLDGGEVGDGMRLGVAAVGIIAVTTLVVWRVEGMQRLLRDRRVAHQGRPDILFHILVRFPLGTALFEEVAFRGVVEGLWRDDGATEREAAAAAAGLFALWHLIPTRDALRGNPIGTPRTPRGEAGAILAGAVTTGLASLVFSWLRRKSGSLSAPWLAHTAVSSAGYLAGVAAWRRLGGR